ncbi:helix-turn-helix domain-containing protein [Larkinella arboricola]
METPNIAKELAEIKKLTQLSAIRQKLLYDVEDVAFLTSFSVDTVYNWIHKGRPVNTGKGRKTIFLKPANGIVERGVRIFPDELDFFLSHFPPAKAA